MPFFSMLLAPAGNGAVGVASFPLPSTSGNTIRDAVDRVVVADETVNIELIAVYQR